MVLLLRHLLAILLLPFVVVVVVPYWLLRSAEGMGLYGTDASPAAWLSGAAGVVVFSGGLVLFGWCVLLFARVGRGTLAPWDPTRALVVVGPYRHVRNPMISGVALMLIGEALFWRSWELGVWAVLFVLVNHAYFVWSEEPGLGARFGEAYRAYRAGVPRWVPRLRPWEGARRAGPEEPPDEAR